MKKLILALALLAPAVPVHAQCTCKTELNALSTTVAQLQGDLNYLKLKMNLVQSNVVQQGSELSELRTRLWPAFYRGPARLEQILAEVEKSLPPVQ